VNGVLDAVGQQNVSAIKCGKSAMGHEHLVRHHQQALARLGYQVALIPPGDGTPPPGNDGASPQHPAA